MRWLPRHFAHLPFLPWTAVPSNSPPPETRAIVRRDSPYWYDAISTRGGKHSRHALLRST
jgi:hypothetical protein